MFSRLRMSRRLAMMLVIAIAGPFPVSAAAPAAPASPLSPPLQNAPSNVVRVSVCVAQDLVEAWDHTDRSQRMSDFKDAAAAYIEGRHNVRVQYIVTVRSFVDFDERNPNALEFEEVPAGRPCPSTTAAYDVPVVPADAPAMPEPSSEAPAVPVPPANPPGSSDDAGARCNVLASEPGDPHGAGAGVPQGQIDINAALPVCAAAASARPFSPRYAYLYGRVLEEARRYGEAASQYARAAEGGDGDGANGLAGLYYAGNGVPRSAEQAARYCRQAADAGVPGAQYRMGFLYLWGEGVVKNLSEAASWFRKAGDAGFADAYAYLGRAYAIANPPDFASAMRWFQYAADKGSAVGGLNLGYLYEGGRGVPQDDGRAVEWFRWAAERDDARSMRQLGLHLREGEGIAWSEAEAMRWFGKAAGLGDVESKSLMAYGYMYGLGQKAGQGRQDYAEAARLFGDAARAGDPVAELDLGVLYANGWGVSQDLARARSLFAQAAASGEPGLVERARQLTATLNAAPSTASDSEGHGDPSWVAPAIGLGVAALIGYALFGGSSGGSRSSDSSDAVVAPDPMSGPNYGDFVFSCTVGGGSINIFGDCGTPSGIVIPH